MPQRGSGRVHCYHSYLLLAAPLHPPTIWLLLHPSGRISLLLIHPLSTRNSPLIRPACAFMQEQVFAVDIHPAARIGKGILLDHGTGVVIGETAVIEDNCSLLQV